MEKRETKKGKHWLMIVVNLILALISVYLFEFWFKSVIKLESSMQIATNMAVVVLTAITYFVANTYYIKGVANTAKKIFILIVLSVAVIGLMLLSVKEPADIVYPFSGVILVSIAFYMLTLTAGTLNTIGMIGLALILATPIAFLKWFGMIDWGMVANLSKFAIFIILFLGGTWSQIRAAIHGIRGVNPTGGGMGDDGDGDGDTGDE
ncbi:hypothetical protein MNB_SV-6-626 [hydrothermal vent metagenome]|uniref:Uncharacterized protein n=1 Tax=hydrothermal vent metagenome TaxID=652676 RepID=A0A1W1CCQ1_9ZZZZ